jgi:hypothetical protein
LAGRVLLKVVCLLMRWTFGLAVLMLRGDQANNAELLVLRRENAVLRRNAGRVRYEPGDRAWFAALMRHYNTARPHQGIGQRIPDSDYHSPRHRRRLPHPSDPPKTCPERPDQRVCAGCLTSKKPQVTRTGVLFSGGTTLPLL